MSLAFSEACERNKEPILAILRRHLDPHARVLEVGSGTGQHAAFFSARMPDVIWLASDVAANLPGIAERLEIEGAANARPPLCLDVRHRPWPVDTVDVVFTANSLHIMSWQCVIEFYRGVGEVLAPAGLLIVYGPVRYRGGYTSASNAAFDRSLRQRDPASGIRDFEAMHALAMGEGLQLVQDYAMPANNQTLVWQRLDAPGSI
jgi:SAM-dependent methyltransferase